MLVHHIHPGTPQSLGSVGCTYYVNGCGVLTERAKADPLWWSGRLASVSLVQPSSGPEGDFLRQIMMLHSRKLVADHQAYLPLYIKRLRGFLIGPDRSPKGLLHHRVRSKNNVRGRYTTPRGRTQYSSPVAPHSPPHLKCCEEQRPTSVVGKVVDGARGKYIVKLQCNKVRIMRLCTKVCYPDIVEDFSSLDTSRPIQ